MFCSLWSQSTVTIKGYVLFGMVTLHSHHQRLCSVRFGHSLQSPSKVMFCSLWSQSTVTIKGYVLFGMVTLHSHHQRLCCVRYGHSLQSPSKVMFCSVWSQSTVTIKVYVLFGMVTVYSHHQSLCSVRFGHSLQSPSKVMFCSLWSHSTVTIKGYVLFVWSQSTVTIRGYVLFAMVTVYSHHQRLCSVRYGHSLQSPSTAMLCSVWSQSTVTIKGYALFGIIITIIIAFKGAIRDFLQSPHSAANCLQHARSSDPSAIVCKSRVTHRALITCKCHVTCHLVRRDSSAIKFDRVEIAFIWSLFYWLLLV